MNDKSRVQLRVSILNAPDWMSPLKFRGWLHSEVEDIQARTINNGVVIIRLHLPEKLRLQISQRDLDKILQKIVDKYPVIYRVELSSSDSSLSFAEMLEEQQRAKLFFDTAADFIDRNNLN